MAEDTLMETDGGDNITREQVFWRNAKYMFVILNLSKVLDLMKEKEALEAELKALGQVLESQGCGMEDALVDGEGFPRSDIDVYQV